MNRSIIILVVVIAVALTGGLVALFLYSSPTSTGSQSTDQFPSQQGTPQISVTGTVPQDMQTKEAVNAAFLKQLPTGDKTQVDAIIIVGGYALLGWINDSMGGQALMQFNTATGQWVEIAFSGGAFSVAALHNEGVPQRIALALLQGILR